MKQSFKPAALFTSALLGLAASMPLHAEVSLYIVAPGDTLWSIANENLKSPHDWKKLMEYNNLSDQSQLKVDQELRIPSEWMKDSIAPEPSSTLAQPSELPPEAIAPAKSGRTSMTPREGAKVIEDSSAIAGKGNTVAATYGQVNLVKGNTLKKLSLNTVIAEKGRIRTGEKSSVNILLADGAMLVLLSNTEVVLSQPVELISGEIEYHVTGTKEVALVSTKAGSVSGQKARFRVASSNDGKQMGVEVEQGSVVVADKNNQRHISSGIATRLSAAKETIESSQGLLRPDIANLAKSSVNGEAHLQWQPINGASGYRAQLVYAANTYLVLFDEQLSEPKLDWRNISPGRYNIRLRSIDDKGLAGLNAELPFVVHGALTPPRSNSPLNGATLPTNKPWIAWSRVPEAYSYTLQLAQDAEFKTDLQELSHQINNYYKFNEALPPGEYYWRVKSVSPKRVESSFGEARMFKIKP